jgi:putative glutamine amidotransferase
MARSPLIGISAYDFTGKPEGYYLPRSYVDGVRAAGGRPLILPPGDADAEHLLDIVDGLILSGGGDVNPSRYGGAGHDSIYHVSHDRDEFEIHLVNLALEREFPLLCICRGLQVLNVALGGDLHAHLPEAVGDRIEHRDPERNPTRHAASVDPTSRLAEILGVTSLSVMSRHHQGARRVGRHLRAVAWAEDGVIEGLEHASHRFCVAVQWHPEMSLDDPVQRRLFGALVTAST